MLIVRPGELTVRRGATRLEMKRLLLRSAREAAGQCGGAKFRRGPGRIYVEGDFECLKRVLSKVFGVRSVSPAHVVTFREVGDIASAAAALWSNVVAGKNSP